MPNQRWTRAESEAFGALKWQSDMGVETVILEAPVNRLQVKDGSTQPRLSNQILTAASTLITTEGPETSADRLASSAKTLSDLEISIRAFNGCALKATATNTVFCDGAVESKVMLIGEAPGADEDRVGKPFVGECGKLLDAMMAAIGRFRPDGFYLSNILPWRPPGNRKPTDMEVAICLPFIRRHIELAAPKLILLLGGTATHALLNINEGITRARGQWYSLPIGQYSAPVMATFHPAYLLRQPQAKAKVWQDLMAVKIKLAELDKC